MRETITKMVIILATLLLGSCATIISKKEYPILIKTEPQEAEILITDRKGNEAFKGTSPATAKLKSNAGFFKKAAYKVTISKEGYAQQMIPINYKVDAWYWSNLLLPPVSPIGMLFVDPFTGAMYKPSQDIIECTLKAKHNFIEGASEESESAASTPTLYIYDIHMIPNEWRQQLVEIKTK